MKKLFLLGLLLALGSIFSSTSAREIPIEDFAKHGKFQDIKISPDGKHLAFTFRDDSQVNLAIMSRKDQKILGSYEFGKWMQVVEFHWANNERVLMEVEKRVGFLDERGGFKTLYAGNIDGKKKAELIKIQNYFYNILSLLEDDPKRILITKNYNTESGKAKPTKLNIYTGRQVYAGGVPAIDATSLLADRKGSIRFGVEFDSNEKVLDEIDYKIAYKKPGDDNWNTLVLPGLKGKKGSTFAPWGLSGDNRYAYVSSNVNSKANSVMQIDLANGSAKTISQNTNVDVSGLLFAEDDTLLAAIYQDGYQTIDLIDKAHPTTKLYKSMLKAFPGQRVSLTSFTKDKKTAMVRVSSDLNPGEFYIFDLETMKASYVASVAEWFKADEMSSMEPFSFVSRDGVTLHGYITVPYGSSGKNLPLIVNPHGGPHGPRDVWSFSRDTQFLASRGYAVMQVNFRGSGGYGYDFMSSGYQKWGNEMQNDLTDAVDVMVKKGIADPNRMCIYGGSYGGYASLMSVVHEPDLYKCALGYVGVYDMETMKRYGDIPTRKAGRVYLDRVLGRDVEQMRKYSPARNVDKIKAALFIAHGRADVRVPMEQYNVLTNALDKAGISYESMVKDEGHGYTQPKNRMEFYTKMEAFFDKHIGPSSLN